MTDSTNGTKAPTIRELNSLTLIQVGSTVWIPTQANVIVLHGTDIAARILVFREGHEFEIDSDWTPQVIADAINSPGKARSC